MKKALFTILILKFVLAFAAGQLGIYHSKGLDDAAIVATQTPTSENQMELVHQKHKAALDRLEFSGVLFAILATPTLFAFWIGKLRAGANLAGPAV